MRHRLALATLAIAALSLPAAANAATVHSKRFFNPYGFSITAELTYYATPGESNNVTLRYVPDLTDDVITTLFPMIWVHNADDLIITDTVPLRATGEGCGNLTPYILQCTSGPISLFMDDGDDKLDSTTSNVRAYCGAGSDAVVATTWDYVAGSCETVARIPT